MNKKILLVATFSSLLIFMSLAFSAFAEQACTPIDKKSIKIEAWISKKFKKQKREIKKEFLSLPHTKVALRVFPMKDPAKVVGIGKCVPAEIGRHALQKALKYTGGVSMLVDQDIISPYWIGIGTMAFDEHSQKKVSLDEVKKLMEPSLSNTDFQKLLAQYSNPKDIMPVFGLELPNSRRSEIQPAWESADAKNK